LIFDGTAGYKIIKRSGASKAKLYVTDSAGKEIELSPAEWCKWLGEQMFDLSSLEAKGSRPPSFRSLFSYFVRRQANNAFTAPEKQAEAQNTGEIQAALMFLLGLDWQIARDWQTVRDREKELQALKKRQETVYSVQLLEKRLSYVLS